MIRCFTLLVIFVSAFIHVNGLAVMSVDLGTEFMKIAIVKPGIPMEIALNKESRRKTPMIVAIKGKDREFGDAAVSRSQKIPSQSYMNFRDLIGKHLDNPVVEQYLKRFPFYTIKSDGHTSELVFEHDSETNYTVEELLAMVLKKAKEYASDFAEQAVDAAVITVPPYFTQSERRAVKRACELANLKLLQLMNDNTAVALNYGIFRRKDFNATGSTYLFYDMGAQSTVCTLVTFAIVKSKEEGYVEEVPQLTVKSVAFDRDLGGLEFQIRLRDYFIEKFHEQQPKIDLAKNGKALTKLFREAERAKHVLSANNEYTAQVEGLVDEIDFKHRITRETFEKLCADLFERVRRPIDEVLNNSGIALEDIQQVLLFGGATRIPRVQDELVKALQGIDLGKSLNTDEAAAMGAVYQAAALSKGYRVKKFLIKDANQYPINVQFERRTNDIINEQIEQKLMDLALFSRKNLFPNRKMITFNRHTDDFNFTIHYGDLSYLSSTDKRALGQTDLSRVYVKGARDAYEKHHATSESKGIKAHFQLDENSLLVLDRIEFTFERKEIQNETNETKTDDEQSTLSSNVNRIVENSQEEKYFSLELGSKISSLFSSSSETEENKSNTTETATPASNSTENTTNSSIPEQNGTNATETNNKNTTNVKIVTVREPLEFRIELLDYVDPSDEALQNSIAKLKDLDAHDQALATLAKAKNNLESFIYDIRDKLENDAIYKRALTEDEHAKVNEKLAEADNWLWEDGMDADAQTLTSKLNTLKEVTKSLRLRVREANNRPQKIEQLRDAINSTEYFVTAARVMLNKSEEDDRPFTQGEFTALEKVLDDVKSWRDAVFEDFQKLMPNEDPKYVSTDIDDKINLLNRETGYLFNKVKRYVPKTKTTTPKPPTTSEPKAEEQEEEATTTTSTTEPTPEETTTVPPNSDEDKHPDL